MALLLWYLVLLSSTLASPVLVPPDVIGTTYTNVCLEHYPPPRQTTCPTTTDAPVFNTGHRSTIEIVWSCLAIIFASTWICVHPNVAGYKTTKWQKLWKRVKLFALAVFAPEFLAVFAFFQWKGCRALHRRFRGVAKALKISLDLDDNSEVTPLQPIPLAILPFAKDGPKCDLCLRRAEVKYDSVVPTPGPWETIANFAKRALFAIKRALTRYHVDPRETAWTLTHSHFVQMGGIVFKSRDNSEVGFKRPTVLRPYSASTSDLDIIDSPGISSNTSSESSSDFSLTSSDSDDESQNWSAEDIKNFFCLRLSEAAISDRSKAGALAKTLAVMQVLWFVVQTIARALEGLPITHLEVVCLAFTVFDIGMYICWWDKPLDVECPVEVEGRPGGDQPPAMDWFWTLMGGLNNLPVGQWNYSQKAKLYPGLYCYHASHDEDSSLNEYFSDEFNGVLGGAFTLALSFTSATFGALHAIAWSLPSPSHTEHMLWQVSCLVLMCYPLVPLVIGPFAVFLADRTPEWVFDVYGYGMAFTSFCGAITYIGARFILLVLPFLGLRDLPPLAHQTISWSNFLPHI